MVGEKDRNYSVTLMTKPVFIRDIGDGAKFMVVVMGLMFSAGSVLRGAGDATAFMMGSLSNFVVRIAAAYILAGMIGSSAIWWSIPMGWGVGLLVNYIRYRSKKWENKAIISKKQVEA